MIPWRKRAWARQGPPARARSRWPWWGRCRCSATSRRRTARHGSERTREDAAWPLRPLYEHRRGSRTWIAAPWAWSLLPCTARSPLSAPSRSTPASSTQLLSPPNRSFLFRNFASFFKFHTFISYSYHKSIIFAQFTWSPIVTNCQSSSSEISFASSSIQIRTTRLL